MRSVPNVALLSWLFFTTAVALANDWPQWRGPQRNGISREVGWLNGWPEGGSPKVAWRAAVGKGHSAISIANGLA